MSWNNWLVVCLGVISIISPWVLGFSDLKLVTWFNVLVGSLVIVFSLWNFNPEE